MALKSHQNAENLILKFSDLYEIPDNRILVIHRVCSNGFQTIEKHDLRVVNCFRPESPASSNRCRKCDNWKGQGDGSTYRGEKMLSRQ